MELAQLRALRELRDRGSIAAVAAAFRVTPSAVSQQLAGLQRSVGVPLTQLEGRRTVLTAAGAALADAAVAVESALIDAANSITEFHDDSAAPVSISAFHSAAVSLFPGLLHASIAGRPRLVLRDQDVRQADYPGLVADTDLVIAQRLVGSDEWPAQLAVVPLVTEPLDLVFRAGHRLDTGDDTAPVGVAELRGLQWIVAHDDAPLAAAVHAIGAAAGAEPLIAHRVNDFAVMTAMLQASDCIALMPRHTGASYRVQGVRTRPLAQGAAAIRRIDVLARPDTLHRRGVRAVVEALRTQAAALVPAALPITRHRGSAASAPPFRAEVVGSYLRPAAVRQARAQRDAGAIDDAALRAVEDDAVRDVIARQADAGLRLATDGEFRRGSWQYDFFAGLSGLTVTGADSGIDLGGLRTRNQAMFVDGRLGFPPGHPMLEHFGFLREIAPAGVTPKLTIPSPAVLHFRLDRDGLAGGPYVDHEELFDDLAATYRDAVRAFYDAGCRYLQFDDTTWTYLCSRAEREKAAARGIRIEGLAERYAELINASLAGKPKDLAVTTHVCGGNFRSAWISTGDYEPVAEQLLAGTDYDGYFLEYDSERAGGFEPLRHVPSGPKQIVLGLLTSKDGALENPDVVKARIDEASHYVGLDQLALSTQCGFASTQDGHALTEAQQWAKVREVVSIAGDVWG
ncbi:5-methyltetrahydropteroyltriglutamate--homocysteine S-methyltransferase [Gryllotalpicola protaetiae]|uniref:5-methyltetrahydropteroyltriglutamate--homocysteine S-methyltransferase n=1 Tax=Gryllotalpicola protaetiae TaxID=2419771 RepID=A0A387BMT9_9MICO|nr:5-methyltetrahydropteroyltriglutamate--homocysteine S-methyltransferase [Gryllotalpicola protaetiae]AYG02307.1 5-methyltetrahydropteroyltriglutamate--homocysteine S-methyltransferase [Gryllotalpicola protaetiae]